MKQMTFFKSQKSKNDFGGTLLNGRRKSARPLGIKKSNHLVLKVNTPFLLLRNSRLTEETLFRYGKKFGVHIYSFAVQYDHIHVSFKVLNREAYKKWIRAVTSVLVARIKGLKFSHRPWTRIVAWGRAFKIVQMYIESNKTEAKFLLQAVLTIDLFRRNFIGHFR